MTEISRTEPPTTRAARYLWSLTRLCLGWTFLWPFLDKTFGLGHETTAAHAWIQGGSPSFGFLSGAAGPFAGLYQSIAGAGWVNWLFMLGLLGLAVVGAGNTLGFGRWWTQTSLVRRFSWLA
jgi:thiosulfate dehydrogenase [quinone] large subunit